MKKLLVCLVILALGMSGCSYFIPKTPGEDLTAGDLVEIQNHQDSANAECWKAQTQKLQNEITMMGKMTADQSYNYMIMQGYKDANMSTLSVLAGVLTKVLILRVSANTGGCNGTNVWDFLARTNEQKMILAGKIFDGSVRMVSDVIHLGVELGWFVASKGNEGGINIAANGSQITLNDVLSNKTAGRDLSTANTTAADKKDTDQTQISTGSGTGGTNNGTQKPCVASPAAILADGSFVPATTCP